MFLTGKTSLTFLQAQDIHWVYALMAQLWQLAIIKMVAPMLKTGRILLQFRQECIVPLDFVLMELLCRLAPVMKANALLETGRIFDCRGRNDTAKFHSTTNET